MLRCRLWRLCDFLWQLNSAVTGVIIRSRGARQLRASCAQSRVSPAGHQEWKRLRLSVCRSLDHSGKDLTCFYTFCKQENLWLGSTWQLAFFIEPRASPLDRSDQWKPSEHLLLTSCSTTRRLRQRWKHTESTCRVQDGDWRRAQTAECETRTSWRLSS